MNLFEWVVIICLPILTIDHLYLSVWGMLRGRKERKETEQRRLNNQSWIEVFQSVDHSFVTTGQKLIDTWALLAQANDRLEKIILKKTERSKPPENPFGHS